MTACSVYGIRIAPSLLFSFAEHWSAIHRTRLPCPCYEPTPYVLMCNYATLYGSNEFPIYSRFYRFSLILSLWPACSLAKTSRQGKGGYISYDSLRLFSFCLSFVHASSLWILGATTLLRWSVSSFQFVRGSALCSLLFLLNHTSIPYIDI